MSTKTIPGKMVQHGFEQLTGLSSAKALTVPNNATLALIQATTQNARYRGDGTDPTAGVGMLLVAGAEPTLYRGDPRGLKFIEATASATVEVTYFG